MNDLTNLIFLILKQKRRERKNVITLVKIIPKILGISIELIPKFSNKINIKG